MGVFPGAPEDGVDGVLFGGAGPDARHGVPEGRREGRPVLEQHELELGGAFRGG